MALTHVQFLEQFLVGQQPIRYNRMINKCYIDMDWNIINVDDHIILECYQVVDPAIYSKAWSERLLQNYATALIKEQWGSNLKKFEGMQLPGGLKFNGQKIFDEAMQERKEIEQIIYNSSLPANDMIG
jgi:hypothetical protein